MPRLQGNDDFAFLARLELGNLEGLVMYHSPFHVVYQLTDVWLCLLQESKGKAMPLIIRLERLPHSIDIRIPRQNNNLRVGTLCPNDMHESEPLTVVLIRLIEANIQDSNVEPLSRQDLQSLLSRRHCGDDEPLIAEQAAQSLSPICQIIYN